jgi:cytochrome oxidase Cu insertion factor (SCO1/SenC/PrrC family)
MRLRDDDEAGITDSPLLMVSVLLAVVLLVVAMTADPIALGTDVGERAPAIEGVAYDGDGWVDFSLEDYFDTSWKEGEPGQWIILEFMDTDCPYCVQSAAEVGDWDAYFDASNSDWNNEDVQVIAVATELNIN